MRRLLVVSASFPPGAVSGAQRPAQLVRRIAEHGFEPFVLTTPGSCCMRVDEQSARSIPASVQVTRIPCRSLWNHARWWQRARPGPARWLAAAGRGIALASQRALPVDDYHPWMLAATGPGAALVRSARIDLIWATAPALSALRLAERLSRRSGVPFVADFRDVRRSTSGETRRQRTYAAAEAAVLRSASGISYVAPEQIELLRARHAQARALPALLAHNWFDAAELASSPPRAYARPTLVHGGILYGGARRLDAFAAALRALRERASQASHAQLEFLALTEPGADQRYLEQLAARHALESAIRVEETLPYPEFLSACRGARVLLLVVGRDSGADSHAGAIPAKLYSYFAACRPILVVGPRGCEAGRMVEALGRGIAAADDAPDEIALALERLLSEAGRAGRLDLSLEAVAPFEARAAVARLAGFLSEVAERAAARRSGDLPPR